MRVFYLSAVGMLFAVAGTASGRDEPAKEKPKTTLKEDAERLVGKWAKPEWRQKNPLGMVVVTRETITFGADGKGTVRTEINVVERPYVAGFTFKLEEREGTRVIVPEGKAFLKKETGIAYTLDGDRLVLESGDATADNGEVPKMGMSLKGEWTRVRTKAELAQLAEKELEKFQGTWTMSRLASEGEVLTEKELKGRTFTFKDSVMIDSSDPKDWGIITLNSTRQLAVIEVDYVKDDSSSVGIYRFDDANTLTVALGSKRRPPTDFRDPKKGQHDLFVLKRQEKPAGGDAAAREMAARLKKLEQENAELRATVDQLRKEIAELKKK